MSRSVRMIVRVAILAAGAAAIILALGTMNASTQVPSPYTSALGDLNVANASAEPNTCSDLRCALNKFEVFYCRSEVGYNCTLNPQEGTCLFTHC